MSNQTRRVNTKSTTKRRAEARRRTREFGRQFFAYFMIAILVLGTISSVIFTSVPGAPGGNVPVAATAAATLPAGQFDILVTQGDQAAAAGKANEAVGYYRAYLGQNAGSPEVNLKLAKAYIASAPPDYNNASASLNRVLTLDPGGPSGSYASEALGLLAQIKDKVTPVSSASRTVITGTMGVVTGTSSVVPGTNITDTRPITP